MKIPIPVQDSINNIRTTLPFPLFLYLGLTLLVYFHALGNGFVFDDQGYVVENPLIKNLDGLGVWKIFSEFHDWDYLPVTLLSFSLDYLLFHLGPAGYHFTNIVLHFFNTLLVHTLIRNLTRSENTALWTALCFLIHPVHVESVAWISERKNVLSLFFFLLAFNHYVRHGLRPLSILLFLFACLSKTSVIIFPLLLVLYDVSFSRKGWMEILTDKVPYFVISGATAAIALISHGSGGTLRDHPDGNPFFTLLSMLVVFKEYLEKMVFPVNLNIWYPNQVYRSLLDADVVEALLVLGIFIWGVCVAWRRDRQVFFGLVWFPVSLLPVSHIIPFPQMMADRFLYIPSIGLLLALVSLARNFGFTANRQTPWSPRFLFLLVVLGFLALSLNRVPVFKEDFTLWRDSIRRNPNNTRSMMYLGLTLWQKGDHDKALGTLRRAREIEPGNLKALFYTARIHEERGDFPAAEKAYKQLIAEAPNDPEGPTHLGILYGNRGRVQEALAQLERAVSLDPRRALAHYNRGVFLLKAGREKDSLAAFQAAVVADPDNAFYHDTLGRFYLGKTNRPNLGRYHLEESLRLDPDQPAADQIRNLLAMR